ncbi:hypothetical protein [Altibacter sp.]|uniref:hypothetical protein n=1 Tax=Altibacter sp. TaxID=2024823 RepID=UPI000C9392EF|nr:hypothetical protein [Altibacter sp.]MAP55695.1 hypothetical protein [Altibacter sp.]|tara:strand:- start:516 stop:737 length:222 start_codon:yes stop_codon:yes gene_type:complete
MKKITLLLLFAFAVFSCKKDDGRACTTCNSPQTANFEVCDDGEGNATVNGENTGTSFDVYIADLEAAGATCGG